MHRKSLLSLSLLAFTLSLAPEASAGNDPYVFVGAGLFVRNAGLAVTDADSGKKPIFSELYPVLSLTGMIGETNEYRISPNLNYAITSKDSPDGGSATRVFAIGVRAVAPRVSSFDFHAGPGVMFYNIKGTGGTKDLNNGAGTTTFGLPDKSVTTRTFYMDLGAAWIWDKLRVETAFLVSGFLSSKIALNPVLTVSWGIL